MVVIKIFFVEAEQEHVLVSRRAGIYAGTDSERRA